MSEGPASQRRWAGAVARYWKQLEKLLTTLDARSQRFFRNVSLHDGWVLGISLGTGRRGRSMTLTMEVEAPEQDRVYQLGYDELSRFELNRVGEQVLFDERDQVFGTWGYDELTLLPSGAYRHEVLFSSGTTLLVEFRRFRVVSKKTVPA